MSSTRYSRQVSLIGEESQNKLALSSVVVIGAGGIGSPCLYYLTAGGIGKIGLIDHDVVNLSNLHRQVLYDEQSIGKSKTAVAIGKLASLNSELKLHEYRVEINLENAKNILTDYDLVIDASDNFKTRYLINDICCQLDKPFINASIFQNSIQIMLFDVRTGCYRCAFPEPPPPFIMSNCSDAGVLGASVGIAGAITANLAINFIIHQNTPLLGNIYAFNCDTFNSDFFPFKQKQNCSACTRKLISWPAKGFDLELDKIQLADYVAIDIRELDENRSKSLTSNDLHIPLSELMNTFSRLPKQKLLLYCKTGARSDYVAYILQKNGFDAFSLKGGV